MSAKSIKAIDRSSVHRICSGQVVVSLAVAVKELVENSLDAGSTRVDVRLKEHGSELIEVSDNGYGVNPENFQALTLKHHTSKLSDFSDLAGVMTFGFRGEALSSLCALGRVSITTRHSSQSEGTAMTFDSSGKIETSATVPRQVGTTVTIENLFCTLPVRRKEFLRNVKKEFVKMTQLLNAYCLVSTGVKISCINQSGKGSKTTFLSTQGCESIKENISCVFGSKLLPTLLEIEMVEPSKEELEEIGLKAPPSGMRFDGYVSTCKHGSGRSAADRQFFYVNSRPCDPAKISKAVNEIYHQYNPHQYPFVFLNIKVDKESVDVNVTPDKRQVFIDQEKYIIAAIKSSLGALFKDVPSVYSVNQPQQLVSPSASLSMFSQFRHKADLKRESSPLEYKQPKQRRLEDRFGFTKTKLVSSQMEVETSEQRNSPQIELSNETIDTHIVEIVSSQERVPRNENDNAIIEMVESPTAQRHGQLSVEILTDKTEVAEPSNVLEDRETTGSSLDKELTGTQDFSLRKNNDLLEDNKAPNGISGIGSQSSSSSAISLPLEIMLDTGSESELSHEIIKTDEDMPIVTVKKTVQLDLDFESLKKDILKRQLEKKEAARKEIDIKFLANIDPSKNSQAESELDKAITKDMFKQMEIIGQFNLGFIITKLKDDLFIIDQHATDEKYNFETLQATTTLSNQKLVIPQSLDLTAANECVLMDSIDIFKKNGFDFIIDDSAPTGKKVKLSAIPMSKNWIFGKDDVDELLFMLEDSPGTMCRPSRVRAMFASRACRSSVMIGDPLGMREMRRLVDHMAEIEQPWNCPHGRPTMRHLVNLNLLKQVEDRTNC